MTTKPASLKPASLIPHGLSAIVVKNTCSGFASTEGIIDSVKAEIRQKYGFKELGDGAYSIVYAHPNHRNKVIKLTLSKTDGYHQYIEWIERAKSFFPKSFQRHLPKIFETKKLRKGGRITVLERLNPNKNWCRKDHRYDSIREIVKETGSQYRLCFDLHMSNSMARRSKSNGQRKDIQVITDPWCENY